MEKIIQKLDRKKVFYIQITFFEIKQICASKMRSEIALLEISVLNFHYM